MRKIAILLVLTMVFGSLAGCLEGDDDDSSLVGDWYMADELIVVLKEDGTWTSGDGDDNGTWSVDGCLLYTSPSPRDKRQSRMPSSA